MEQQRQSQTPISSGCIVLALIGLVVWWCFIRTSSHEEEKPTTPPTSSLPPSELKYHRKTFLDFEPTISIHRARYNGCISTWQKIFNDLSRNRISALQAYERLHGLQKAVDLLRSPSWEIPESLPKDVRNLLKEAETNYGLAAMAFYEAIEFAKEFLDTHAMKAYTQAKEHLELANSYILKADLAVANAKKKLGFK